MFAQTARFAVPLKVREREKQRRARRRDWQRETARQKAQRSDFAKREGEALERLAFSFL